MHTYIHPACIHTYLHYITSHHIALHYIHAYTCIYIDTYMHIYVYMLRKHVCTFCIAQT